MSSSTSSPATQFSPISSDDPDMVIVTPLRGSPLLAPPPPPPTSRSSKSEHSTPPVASTSRFIHASPISPRTSLLARAAAAYELTEEEEEDEEQGNATELLEEGEGEGLLKDSPIDGQGSGVNERRIALKYHPKSGIEEEWRSRGAGLISGIANMSNSILGAGIIGLPYALREAGLVTGVILIVLLGAVTDWTIRLILLTSKMSGRSTYIDIMDACQLINFMLLLYASADTYSRACKFHRFRTSGEINRFHISILIRFWWDDSFLSHLGRHDTFCPSISGTGYESLRQLPCLASIYCRSPYHGSIVSAIAVQGY